MTIHCIPLSDDVRYLANLDRRTLIEVAALRGQLLGVHREERAAIEAMVRVSFFNNPPVSDKRIAETVDAAIRRQECH